MSFEQPIITYAGKDLHAKVLTNKTKIRFTSIAMGSGVISDANWNVSTLTALGTEVTRLDVTAVINDNEHGVVEVRATFNNQYLGNAFDWSEIGLYCENPDYPDDRSKDILYAYQNAYTYAEHIPANTTCLVEKIICLGLVISNTDTVEAYFNNNAYVLYSDIENLDRKVTSSITSFENTVNNDLNSIRSNVNTQIQGVKDWVTSWVNDAMLNKIYPVGSIYMSINNVSPQSFLGGIWQRLADGRVLICSTDGTSNNSYPAGSTGGEFRHTLSEAEMPNHLHNVSVASAGSHSHGAHAVGSGGHTHTVTMDAAGNHTHTRGSMNITGTFESADDLEPTGAFYQFGIPGSEDGGSGLQRAVGFDASRTWVGQTSENGNHGHTLYVDKDVADPGAHSHTVTIDNNGEHSHNVTEYSKGSNYSHENMQPYLSVFMWKRVS